MFLKPERKELEWVKDYIGHIWTCPNHIFFVRLIRVHYKSQVNFFQIQI